MKKLRIGNYLRKIFVGAGIAILSIGIVGRASACRCGWLSLERGFQNSDVVFVGVVPANGMRVVNPKVVTRPDGKQINSGNARVYTFNVATLWKGSISRNVDVSTIFSGPACGSYFEEHTKYLVFAGYSDQRKPSMTASATFLDGDKSSLSTHFCKNNVKLDGNRETPKIIKKLERLKQITDERRLAMQKENDANSDR